MKGVVGRFVSKAGDTFCNEGSIVSGADSFFGAKKGVALIGEGDGVTDFAG